MTITNTVTVTSQSIDPDLTNDQASASTVVRSCRVPGRAPLGRAMTRAGAAQISRSARYGRPGRRLTNCAQNEPATCDLLTARSRRQERGLARRVPDGTLPTADYERVNYRLEALS